jgi:hypothetical protein
VRGLDYIVEECPLVAGNTGTANKALLDELERASPGIKAQFLFGFLDRAAARWDDDATDAITLVDCSRCDMPTPAPTDGDTPVCAFCRQRNRVLTVLGQEPA